jgi:hypothetical protein
MVLCATCAAFVFGIFVWDVSQTFGPKVRSKTHHVSWQALSDAITSGCGFCVLIGPKLQGQRGDAFAESYFVVKPVVIKCHSDYAPTPCAIIALSYESPNNWRYKARLEVRPGTGDMPFIGIRRPAAARDVQLWGKWLHDCSTSHMRCASVEDKPLPTRLIDVGGGSSKLEPRLVETSHARGRYLTLSHCWGQFVLLTTTTRNYDDHLRSLPLCSLPRKFREAIEMTASLGFHYIWIDSLYIIQDSPADWAYEGLRMAEVYSNSVLTLAASAASNATYGLLLQNSPEQTVGLSRWLHVQVPSAGHGVSVSIGIPCSQKSMRNLRLMNSYPLARRSWVLQERLLSPRILHCGADDIVFEYNSATYAGSFVHALPPTETWGSTTASTLLTKSALQHGNSDLLLDSWYSVLMSYRGLELTHERDRLPAIAG